MTTSGPDEADAVLLADASLRFSSDAEPGITRRKRGKGFSYLGPKGEDVSPERRGQIDALAIPPAWTGVWICRSDRGHLQATGRDDRGRKQYRYHDRWREVRDADKFERLPAFGAALPELRETVDADLSSRGLTPRRITALVVRLLDETMIRIGNPSYAVDNGSFGLTTLKDEHVELGSTRFLLHFPGKSGVEHDVAVSDRRLTRLVQQCHQLGGHSLFTYAGDHDEPVPIGSSDVNGYLRDVMGIDATAKTFRTWGGTCAVIDHLASSGGLAELGADATERQRDGVILDAIDAAAEQLHNTRAVCRASYVHPVVLDAAHDGRLLETWSRSHATRRMQRAEQVALHLLS